MIDRRPAADNQLPELLSRKCKRLYCVRPEEHPAANDDWTTLSWDGEVDGITTVFEAQVLPDLAAHQLEGKIKVLIPSLQDPSKAVSADAVHQDDETIALVLKLKTLDSGRFHFISEILCLRNLMLFRENDIQQSVPVHEFISLALTKLTLFGGEVTGLLIRLMENFFTGELEDRSLQKITVEDTGISGEITGKNFEEATRLLMTRGIQLIAIMSHGGASKDAGLVVLPHRTDGDYKRKLQSTDSLFVIA